MKMLMLLALAALTGCSSPTEVRTCIRKGDTIAKVLVIYPTHTDTTWLVSDKDSGCR